MAKIAQTVIPTLTVDGGLAALEFYVRAFGAREIYKLVEPGDKRKLAHAEIELRGSRIMIADEYPELGYVSPKRSAGRSSALTVYVDDVDALAARATAAGAEIERPLRDEFYGDRVVSLIDPFGHRWSFHTIKEQLTDDEIQRRYEKLVAGS